MTCGLFKMRFGMTINIPGKERDVQTEIINKGVFTFHNGWHHIEDISKNSSVIYKLRDNILMYINTNVH